MIVMIAFVLAALGVLFILLAAVGILRLPDLYTRMHASSKAATLGAILVLLSVAVHFGGPAVWVRCLLIVVILFMTAPIAAHMIARAAYIAQVRPSPDTRIDELGSETEL